MTGHAPARHRAGRHLQAVLAWTPEVVFLGWLGVLTWFVTYASWPTAVVVGLTGLITIFVLAHAFELGRRSATGQHRW